MPELPEVETVKEGLNQTTLDQNIVGGDVLLTRTIARPLSASEFISGVQNVAIARWYRRGKYLLARLAPPGRQPDPAIETPRIETQTSEAGWLGVHLRMTGQLLWLTPEEPLQKHTRVRLFFAGGRELRFVDQRTFGQMWWVPPDVVAADVISGLRELGPEPLSEEFSPEYLAGRLRLARRPVKTALLDQSFIAGLGNIYADEALFLSGIRPTTPSCQVTSKQVEALHPQILRVLEDAIASGGTTIRNFLNVEGVNGNYGGRAWVYNREGEPCRVCETPIQRLKLAGRSAHFCPRCQH
ncbi:DNA-formamidopyrimidine glycosylase [Lyngbya sp. CCY1209]|uniref:DNA-formamidopyrimidine glycosylase n=1 Tax=Lyngbya sp. CCY1209 TaxID=2886103 RepID=UPI002D20C2B6|nr:DNA-formamidopyrimidine glycosylase [Lyngbya sp. CCY1209]MEB3887431.1 DNA-formamidopyrimidine glycosylase [Lyngbya sp. CCY1209]